MCDDGIVIDLGRLKGIRVDAARAPRALRAAAPGEMWTMPRMSSAWRLLAA